MGDGSFGGDKNLTRGQLAQVLKNMSDNGLIGKTETKNYEIAELKDDINSLKGQIQQLQNENSNLKTQTSELRTDLERKNNRMQINHISKNKKNTQRRNVEMMTALTMNMTQEELTQVQMLTNGKTKSLGTFLIMWLFGIHYIYTGEVGKFLGYLFTFGGFGLWILYSLITSKSKVEKINEKIVNEVAVMIRMSSKK